jgi:uncharacterized protein
MLPALLPAGLDLAPAAFLVVLSALTSGLTAMAGIGGGVIMLAALASLLPPAAIIPVHAVVQVGSNAGRAAVMRHWIDRGRLVPFALGSVVGIAIGGSLAVSLPGEALRVVLGLFILQTIWLPIAAMAAIKGRGLALGGLIASFLTMLVGATGPYVLALLRPLSLGREGLVATHAAAMTAQHGLKMLAFGFLGFAFAPWLPLIALMIAAGFVGTLVGRRLLGWLDERLFGRLVQAILTIVALDLVLRSGWQMMNG